MPMRSGPCKTAREHADAGDCDPRLRAGDGGFEVLGEAAATAKPGKSALNDPAFWFGLEGPDTLRPGDNLNGPSAELGDRVEQFVTAIDAISEDVPQLGKCETERFQKRHRAVIVLNVGGVHLDGEQRNIGIGDDVALTPFHLLSHIKPAWAATFRGLNALAVDNAGRGRGLTSRRPANTLDEHTIDPVPNSPVAPAVEVILNGRARRKVLRHGAPLAAGGKNVEDGVHHHAQIDLARSSDPARLGHQRSKHLPLLIRRVACIAQAITPILFAGGFGPRHVALPRRIANTKESQQGRNHSLLFRPGSQDEENSCAIAICRLRLDTAISPTPFGRLTTFPLGGPPARMG